METRLMVEYDATGDILYLNKVKPYPEQDSEELEYGIIARKNPQTGEIENLEVLFFSSRAQNGTPFELPVLADFHATQTA